jgi:Protein of unknown function (DUF3485)
MTFFPGDIGDPRALGVATASREQRGTLWNWIWMGLACGLLLVSGVVRFWEDRRVRSLQIQTVSPLFPLKSLDETMGRWHSRESTEAALDEEIARVAGSSDSIIRTYVDRQTGVSVAVLILYGRAGLVTAHTPEVCYASQGYKQREASVVNLDLIQRTASGFDFQRIPSVNNVSSIPTAARNRVIVAEVGNVLHFRIFDGTGKIIVNVDETSLKTQARAIAELRQSLKNSGPTPQLSNAVAKIIDDARPSQLRSLQFTKEGGREGARQEVFYAFRNEGRWSPDVEGSWKALEASPPVFKIMVQRRLAEGERRDRNNPSFQFLTDMLPVLEDRIRAAEQARQDSLGPAT